MLNVNKLPIIRHGENVFSVGGNLYFLGGMGLDSSAGQFMSKNQGALAGGAGVASQAIDLVAPENSIGGGAAKGALKGASMGAALGPWGALAGGAIGGIAGGIGAGKAQNEAEIAARKQSIAQMASQRSMIDPYAKGTYANGGELPGITQFNNGGTHEQNPLGGIPQGISAANGQPNLVEQGETKRNGFIYSDRLPVINTKEYNLPSKYEGKTFAQASKLASKYIEDRPNDPIAQKGQEVALNRLKSANEEAKQMKDMAEQGLASQEPLVAKNGGKINSCAYGGYTFTDY